MNPINGTIFFLVIKVVSDIQVGKKGHQKNKTVKNSYFAGVGHLPKVFTKL